MKKSRYAHKSNRKAWVAKPSKPFEGLVNQLKKESLVLINLQKAKPFAAECFKRGLKVGVGDTYKDGVIIYLDK